MSTEIVGVDNSGLKQKSEIKLFGRNGSVRVAGMEGGSERIRARAEGRGEIEKKQEENG